LREAIQKLSAKGLLVSRQGGGNYVATSLGSTFSDPLLQLLESNPEAQRDLLEFRHTLEASCAFTRPRGRPRWIASVCGWL
jgi:Transcriptional regulators